MHIFANASQTVGLKGFGWNVVSLLDKCCLLHTNLAAFEKLVLGMSNLLLFATPSAQNRSLQRPVKGETHGPGLAQGHIVDSIQINSGFLLRLGTATKKDSWNKIHFDKIKSYLVTLQAFCKFLPGTAGGTVRRIESTVASPMSEGGWFLLLCRPGVTILGCSRVPSKKTWCSLRAL